MGQARNGGSGTVRVDPDALARALATAAAESGLARRELAYALGTAARPGVGVSADGAVHWPPEMHHDPDVGSGEPGRQASAVHQQIADALRKATEADREAARDLSDDMGIRQDAFDASAHPGRRADPQTILDSHQVKGDPRWPETYPAALTAWIFGQNRSEVTATGATMPKVRSYEIPGMFRAPDFERPLRTGMQVARPSSGAGGLEVVG